MKRLWKKAIAGILVLVLCMGLLSTSAFAVEDNIVVIREDTTIEDDFSVDGELYIVEGAHLVTTGDVTIYGEVYVFGSWRNTGNISGEGTIHCLHYNSMSFAYDATGHFSSSTNSGGRNPSLAVSVNNSYLSTPIPEGHTYDPETGETTGPESEDEPDSEPEDPTKPEPDASPMVWSGTTSVATYFINAFDASGNYYSSAISDVSVSNSSFVVGTQTRTTFSIGFTLANGWEIEEVTCNGTSLTFEYNSDTGRYSVGATYNGQANPTLSTDIILKWVGIDETEPESDPEPDSEPEGTTDSGTGSTTDSGTGSTTDSEPEGTTDSGTESTTDSGTKSTTDSAGHTYDFDNIVWEWTNDYSAANAFVYCVDGDGAAKAYEAEVESYSNDYGGITHVATIVDENGNVYSEEVVLDAAGNPISSESGTDSSGTDSSGTDSSGTSGTSGTASTVSTDSSGTGSTASTLSTSGTGDSGTGSTGSTSSTGSSGTGSSGSASSYTGSSGSSGSGSGYTGSSGSSGSSSTGTAAKTDDNAMPYLYLTLILAAGAAVVTFSVRRRVTRG